MRDEIAAAVVFISRVVKQDNDAVNKEQMVKFSDSLSTVLRERFKNHWYEDRPHKGQGYRCIRVNGPTPDPVLEKAASDCGLKYPDLKLPDELTVWVDPREVTCRMGECQGSSYYTVATFREGKIANQAHTLDICKVLDDHNQKRNQAFSHFQQTSSSRTNMNSSNKDDAGVTKSPYYSPAKHRAPKQQHLNHHSNNGFHRQMHKMSLGGNHHYMGYSLQRGSPPMVDVHRISPPFMPNMHVPMNNRNYVSKRMRGPDLVKA